MLREYTNRLTATGFGWVSLQDVHCTLNVYQKGFASESSGRRFVTLSLSVPVCSAPGGLFSGHLTPPALQSASEQTSFQERASQPKVKVIYLGYAVGTKLRQFYSKLGLKT